jgi:hypothetical protein
MIKVKNIVVNMVAIVAICNKHVKQQVLIECTLEHNLNNS